MKLQTHTSSSPIAEAIDYISTRLTDDPYFIKNTHGKFIYANERFLQRCRVETLDELVGSSDSLLFPPILTSRYLDDDQRVLKTLQPIIDRVELTPNAESSPNWSITHKFPIYDQKSQVAGLIGTFKDPALHQPRFQNMHRLSPAIDYIRENYNTPIRMADLAQLTNLTERTFYRHFKNVFDLSPHHYLLKHRILEAVEIFRAKNASISETALHCGFYDQSHFTREFKNLMGITPKKYLKKYYPNG